MAAAQSSIFSSQFIACKARQFRGLIGINSHPDSLGDIPASDRRGLRAPGWIEPNLHRLGWLAGHKVRAAWAVSGFSHSD